MRNALTTLEVDATFGEVLLKLRDQSRVRFCHRVGQRWARAEDTAGAEAPGTLAAQVLNRIALFRLNAKHLDIQFDDGSRFETQFGYRHAKH